MKHIILMLAAALQFVPVSNSRELKSREEYSRRITKNDSLLSHAKLRPKVKCTYLEQNLLNKDSIIIILDSAMSDLKNKLSVSENKWQKAEHELKVKDFLLCRDTSVFGSKFIEIDTSECPCHIREYYLLVRDLRDAKNKLISIGQKVDVCEQQNQDMDQETKQIILRRRVGEQVLKLKEFVSDFKMKIKDTKCLSEEQMKSFEDMILELNKLIRKIYH